MTSSYRWFLAGQACWFAAFGTQVVLFPYLIVNVLKAPAEDVGIAQACLMAPALLFMIPGGMLADASDLKRLSTRLKLTAILPTLTLALITFSDQLDYSILLVYALLQGSLQALVSPTRDALLGRVAGEDIQRSVTTAMAVQFVAQMVGYPCLRFQGSTSIQYYSHKGQCKKRWVVRGNRLAVSG